ncbi:MAG TPA: hypothetical protein VGI64_12290 [Streptosporangiaceae bacterium]
MKWVLARHDTQPGGQPGEGLAAMKGDRVEIVVDAGDGSKTYDVTATRAGRRVEVVNRRGLVEVSELTRGGNAVRTARFMASRVIALVEHPATSADGNSRIRRAESPRSGIPRARISRPATPGSRAYTDESVPVADPAWPDEGHAPGG